MVRSVELPWLPVAELRKSLGLQVADLLPMPVDQAVLDFHPLEEVTGERGRTVRGLLVAAARDTVLANVRCAERAGLTPTSVDLTSFAVLRALGSGAYGDGATEVLVDVGARVTNIVVHVGGVPSFVRILLMGGQDITDALAERVGSSLAEAEGLKQAVGMDGRAGPQHANAARAVDATAQSLVDEIRGSLDYYASTSPGRPVERVVLSGGGSHAAGSRRAPRSVGAHPRRPRRPDPGHDDRQDRARRGAAAPRPPAGRGPRGPRDGSSTMSVTTVTEDVRTVVPLTSEHPLAQVSTCSPRRSSPTGGSGGRAASWPSSWSAPLGLSGGAFALASQDAATAADELVARSRPGPPSCRRRPPGSPRCPRSSPASSGPSRRWAPPWPPTSSGTATWRRWAR